VPANQRFGSKDYRSTFRYRPSLGETLGEQTVWKLL
jgi:hypothetical protein